MGISYQEIEGLAVTAYAGDRTVLLAFDLPEEMIGGLAGFAIAVSDPDAAPKKKGQYFIPNRLKFGEGVTAKTPYDASIWTPSDKAPFQSFHWAHYPSLGAGTYTYTVSAMYFGGTGGTALKQGPSVNVTADLSPPAQGTLGVGFTRTMISSQAYANKFNNKPLYPEPQSIDFDNGDYARQYAWLGAHAWEMIMAFLDAGTRDPEVTLDIFAFDLNEPEIIRKIAALGSRARVFQDNSVSHCSASTDVEGMQNPRGSRDAGLEPEAIRALRAAGVAVKTGHFGNLSHNKVMVRRRGGTAEAVLTGSANFTIRGLYVQANSVLVFDEPAVADLYARAFDQAWDAPTTFRNSAIAKDWHELTFGGNRYAFSFAPHKTPFPLDRIKDAIDGAERSVLFAMMQMQLSKGVSIDALKGLPEREDLYSMGVIQHKGDVGLFKPDTGVANFTLASASYLAKNVPPPFRKEISGGSGQVIHHKLVVCDFNGKNPVVFCGSSNLASGGETGNSDNLMAIYDRDVAVIYAVEAIRQYDHFRFRSLQEGATKTEPLMLKTTDAWARPYYEKGTIRYRERLALMWVA